MPEVQAQFKLGSSPPRTDGTVPAGLLRLCVTVDLAASEFRFDWTPDGVQDAEPVASGRLFPADTPFAWAVLKFQVNRFGREARDHCGAHASSVRALLNRIRKSLPLVADVPRYRLLSDVPLGAVQPGTLHEFRVPPGADFWTGLGSDVLGVARALTSERRSRISWTTDVRIAFRCLACAQLGIEPHLSDLPKTPPPTAPAHQVLDLEVTFDQIRQFAGFSWSKPHRPGTAATGHVYIDEAGELTWETETCGKREVLTSDGHRQAIRVELDRWLKRFPSRSNTLKGRTIKAPPPGRKSVVVEERSFGPDESPAAWIEDNLVALAEAGRLAHPPVPDIIADFVLGDDGEFLRSERRWLRKEQKRAEEEQRRQQNMARLAEERRRKAERKKERRTAVANERSSAAPAPASPSRTRPPLPDVPMHIELSEIEFQETAFPLTSLDSYRLRERAALWWVSNQSDDLLCLPHCHIQRLDYQLRSALRVLGPLRGRALLSDEVGLGKTIEAGLVLKELLTRGMVKRFLVLTMPSLVDQWAEELNDKFGLSAVTTNDAALRGEPRKLWCDQHAVIASLHTLKQPAHLELARQVHWDMLVVDEAHHLRNRDSLAWQAVNVLPRHFLLLLTATPVQNSLEDLYNLVTLLQPGQLPSPKEFRARFIDRKRPRQPREPEELRRLLGQVMIRNTRANAGLNFAAAPRRDGFVRTRPCRTRVLAAVGKRIPRTPG